MRKAERLFQLITLLRGRRLAVTAKQLAEILEVSQRTVYRDIQALMVSGVPIEGEAGIGYLLHRDFNLPPLMFSSEELLALLVGSKMVQTWGDKAMATSATSAMEKITAVLPDNLKRTQEQSPVVIPTYFKNNHHAEVAALIRKAITAQQCIQFNYSDENASKTSRKIEPLGVVFWGNKWTIIGFCKLRNAYREFRLDRMTQCSITDEIFTSNDTKNLTHYLSLVCSKPIK